MEASRSVEHSSAETVALLDALHAASLLPVAAAMATDFAFEYLATEAGSVEMAVDGTTPIVFAWEVPAGVDLLWTRTNLYAVDDVMEAIDGFFSLATLGNGLLIAVRDPDGNLVEDFATTAHPITRHAQFGALAGIDVGSDTTANKSRFSVRWTMTRAGAALRVPGEYSIELTVQDDLSDLTEFRAMIQGVCVPSNL